MVLRQAVKTKMAGRFCGRHMDTQTVDAEKREQV
jgi:hypothetical protein